MKTLILVRHSKSSWDNIELTDKKRPLSQRGLRDAPFMGEILKEQSVMPDLIISSPAERAFSTARLIAEKLNYPPNEIEIDNEIYRAIYKDLYKAAKHLNKKLKTVMIVGHNPELTEFLSSLTNAYVDDIPTTGICIVKLNISEWTEICEGCGKLIGFEYPKKYLD